MNTLIPSAFLDLVDGPRVAALTTLMPDGRPQTTVVWCNYDGIHVLVNTMRGFRKERNMRRDPRVTLLGYDPRRPLRALEVRGTVVAMTEDGAMAHLDALCAQYTGVTPYFGACVPAALAATETPVLCTIRPTHVVVLDATDSQESSPTHSSPVAEAPHTGDGEGRNRCDDTATRSLPIPASHCDLLVRPIHAVLTTLMPNGQPQSSLVWCDDDGVCIRVNTSRERQKGKNMAADSRVSVLIVDPDDTSRYLEVRGDAALDEEGALAHLDALTRRYTRHPRFYRYVYPIEQQARETRIIARITAVRITRDAIHR
jgi:PPOX class probable F420-dependent enzyme